MVPMQVEVLRTYRWQYPHSIVPQLRSTGARGDEVEQNKVLVRAGVVSRC